MSDPVRPAAVDPVPPADVQAQFEKWVRENHPDIRPVRTDDPNAPYDYVNAFVESMWDGWRAAHLQVRLLLLAAETQQQEPDQLVASKIALYLTECGIAVSPGLVFKAWRAALPSPPETP